MLGLAVTLSLLLSCTGPASAAPDISPVQAKSKCQYTTTRGANLAFRPFPILTTHAPNLAACRSFCTDEPGCGNVEFRPAQSPTDQNCNFQQQFHYEPYQTVPAPASHVVLSIKRNSCAKGTAKRVPLKCTPGLVNLKGTDCTYNVTCGAVIAPHVNTLHGQQGVFGTQANLGLCFSNGGLEPFPDSGLSEALSFSEGGSCIVFESPFYNKKPIEKNEPGLVYQIVKNSCNAKAAKPKKGKEDGSEGQGKVVTRLAGM